MTPDKVRAAQVDALRREADDSANGSLAQTVQHNLLRTWETGGRRGRSAAGRRPNWIIIRPEFLLSSAQHPAQAGNLVRGKGLQLRLELLLLFEAQCRHEVGEAARQVHSITRQPDSAYAALVDMVLTETNAAPNTDRGSVDLRARQISEALIGLDDQHLVKIPRKNGRRRIGDFSLLEEGSPTSPVRYVVPARGLVIPREFFTNLWVFALSDAELAAYLAVSLRRVQYPGEHASAGVYVTGADRKNQFGLTRWAWRSIPHLYQYGLIDRRVEGRDFVTGKIGGFDKAWARNEVRPQFIQLVDAGAQQPALETIYRVLAEPTPDDALRRAGWFVPESPVAIGPNGIVFSQPAQPRFGPVRPRT
jgi:hypothetical protein